MRVDRKVVTLLSFLDEHTLMKVKNARVDALSSSYEEFKCSLKALIGRTDCVETYRSALDTSQQDSAESVTDYAARVMGYATRAYLEFSAAQQAVLAAHAFVR